MDIQKIQDIVRNDGIIFLSYGGFLSQKLISGMIESLEKEADSSDLTLGDSSNIFTIFIELSQNLMNYSKDIESDEVKAEGLVLVSRNNNDNYVVHSNNIISIEDKNKLEQKLENIKTLSLMEIKKEYRELRRSGSNTHGKGAGIGFYEIAKRSESIDFSFTKINEKRFYFHFKATVTTKKDIK